LFSDELREVFLSHHAELLTADFWCDLKVRHAAEQWVEVVPYGDTALPAAAETDA